MRLDFKVGKKFQAETGHIYECVWTDGRYSLMWLEGYVPVTVHTDNRNWKEHVEPRHEFFNAFKKDENGQTYYTGPYPDREYADFARAGNSRGYGVLELIHHSDNGTREGGSQKVESVFHMVGKK